MLTPSPRRLYHRQHARRAAAEGDKGPVGGGRASHETEADNIVDTGKTTSRRRPGRVQGLQGCQVLPLLQGEKHDRHWGYV